MVKVNNREQRQNSNLPIKVVTAPMTFCGSITLSASGPDVNPSCLGEYVPVANKFSLGRPVFKITTGEERYLFMANLGHRHKYKNYWIVSSKLTLEKKENIGRLMILPGLSLCPTKKDYPDEKIQFDSGWRGWRECQVDIKCNVH